MSDDLSAFQRPGFARKYADFSVIGDRRGAREHRVRLLAGLRGRVIEVGAGNGRNFPHYPATVTEVVAVEPEHTLRGLAVAAARSAPVPVSVVAGHAGALPGEAGTFDAAVVSLVLCSVPAPAAALAEVARVLKPGGELRFYEHVRSERAVIGLLEDAVTPLWTRLAGGCRPNRDTLAEIRRAGFAVEEADRFAFSPQPLMPPFAHLLGRARLPVADESFM
ncbi:class I SAM-dependent methyltransferase [Nonomuraea candida]|uniref:class I SAM-dependent methyltransferase n=1 Tax=Nonomuraea candida TaxID=359159 RepID=UPI0005B8D3F5|nr:methyltransferase domain-containing protein [Nonomuraea candida]